MCTCLLDTLTEVTSHPLTLTSVQQHVVTCLDRLDKDLASLVPALQSEVFKVKNYYKIHFP